MSEFVAAAIVFGIPFMLGLVPLIVAGAASLRAGWTTLLVMLGMSALALAALADTPHGYHMIPLMLLWSGLGASAIPMAMLSVRRR